MTLRSKLELLKTVYITPIPCQLPNQAISPTQPVTDAAGAHAKPLHKDSWCPQLL